MAAKRSRRRPRLSGRALLVVGLTIGLVLFVAATVVVALFALQQTPPDFLGHPVTNATDFRSFWLSLTASFIEDLVFFALLGVGLTLASMRSPADDTLESRITNLLNGTKVSPDLRQRLRRNIQLHCAYSPKYKVNITYTGQDAALKAARMVVTNERKVVNGFRDVTFEDLNATYGIFTDKISAVGDHQGELMAVQTVEDGQTVDHVLTPLPIPSNGLTNKLPLSIPPDGESSFYYKYWIWNLLGEAFFIDNKRFTSEVEVTCLNGSDYTLLLKCHVHDHDLRLPPGQEHIYRLTDQQPTAVRLFTLVGMEPSR